MKKLFFLICLFSFSFFATLAIENLSGNEPAIAENSNVNLIKNSHPRPFKGIIVYNTELPGVGIGKATHMGFITTDLVFDPITSIGTETAYASDGSKLYWTWTWDMSDNTGVFEINGGTGRFEEATGNGVWSGVYSSNFQFFTIKFYGTIVY